MVDLVAGQTFYFQIFNMDSDRTTSGQKRCPMASGRPGRVGTSRLRFNRTQHSSPGIETKGSLWFDIVPSPLKQGVGTMIAVGGGATGSILHSAKYNI